MILLAAKSPIILLCFSKSAFDVDLFAGILLPWKLLLRSPQRTHHPVHISIILMTESWKWLYERKHTSFYPLNSCLQF